MMHLNAPQAPHQYIRLARIDDVPSITHIYNQTVGIAHANFEPVSIEHKEAWFYAHGKNRPIFVLVDEADVVMAWLSLSDYLPRPAYHLSVEVSIYVDELHKGKGFGSRLLAHACQVAPSYGIVNLIALIYGHNQASIALFEKHQFSHWGCLPRVCLSQGVLTDIAILGRCVESM